MVSNPPEYLVEEVRNTYGVEVPLETAITYLESIPELTPDALYDLYTSYDMQYDCGASSGQQSHTVVKLHGYKFTTLENDEVPAKKGVYIWLLKDDAVLPSVDGCSPQYSFVDYNGKQYRVLYIGQTQKETLYNRVVKTHLRGNPRNSTLCWSLAAIMGKPYVLTDQNKPKLDKKYCQEISDWLRKNCYLMYKVCKNVDDEEYAQIQTFCPPLNLADNPLWKTDPFIVKVSGYRKNPGGYQESAYSNSLHIIKRIFFWLIVVSVCLSLLYFAFMN